MSENLKTRIKKEQAKLDADPFNIQQNELVDQLKAQQKTYQDYVFNAMQSQTEENKSKMQSSITDELKKYQDEIAQEEKSLTGSASQSIKGQRKGNSTQQAGNAYESNRGGGSREQQQRAAEPVNIQPGIGESSTKEEERNDLKQKQYDIINQSNPINDDIHTGIRSVSDVLTAEEAFNPSIESNEGVTPDFTVSDMKDALKNGRVTVYSSNPIQNGTFVTPSKMEAQNYAGKNKIYSKTVPLTNVAWIDAAEGQYAEPMEVNQKEQSSYNKALEVSKNINQLDKEEHSETKDKSKQAERSNEFTETAKENDKPASEENSSITDDMISEIDRQKESIRAEVSKMTAAQREKWWGEPQSLREYIMREFINGQKILWSDTPTSQGLGRHLGLGRSENERRKYIGLIGSQGKTNAKSPEAIAHQIWDDVVSKGEQDEIGTLFHGYDTMQVLGELLDVLSSYYSKGQMIDAINESRLDQIFEEMDMAVNASMSSNAWDIDPNEESQNKMLRLLYSDDAYDDITDQEINEYYVKQVTFDEFEEQISNFIKNYSSYDETGISGSDYKNAEQGSESSYGERRDQDSTGDSESTGEIDRNDEGEAEAPEESAEPIRDGENDQEGGSENAQGSSDGNQNVDGERIDQLIKRAEANLKAKQTAYSRLYDKYLSLKNKAEKDPNYGMAGQADIFGGVSGSDNLFANNRDEINSGIRQLIIKAKAQAEDAEMEFNSARKELDRLKTEQTNKKFGQKELFGSEPNGEIESASNRYDVNGNKILTAEEWNSLSKEQQEKHENTINKPVTDLEGNTFNVDYNIAEPLQKIINAGFATGQSDSGTLSDHPGYRYVEDDKLGRYKKGEPVNNTGAYLTFWKPEATKIAEAGRKINTQEQIDYIRNVANKLGFEVLDTNIFNQPSIHLSLPYTNNGKGRQEILNEAGKLTDKKYPGLKEKNFLEWIDKRNEEFEPIVVQKNGGIKIWTDQEIINKWNDLADELAKFNDTNSNEKVTNNYNDRKQALTQEADKVIKEVDWKPTKNGNNANQEIDKKEKLEDFGEKIGGARKDMGITRKARDTDSLPAWRRKYRYANADSKITIGDKVNTDSPFSVVYVHKSGNRESLRTVTDIFSKGWTPKIFNSEQEAEDYIPIFEANLQGFRVSKKSENEYVIGKRSSTGKTIEFVSFPTREEAETYLRSTEGATSLLNRKREDFSIPALENVERTGKDYRRGRNISTDEFMKTFGFRGGEFGNWVKPEERQTMLNMAYDSFMDMADILGISPRAISLNGELGIAFGSRGIADASAHFEPLRTVINLTRMNGAGSLAHEWAHALDNYFGLQAANKNYAKDKNGELIAGRVFKSESDLSYIKNGMRDELRRIFENIVKSTQKKKAPQDVAIEKLQNQYDNILKHVDREANSLVNKFELGVKRYKYDRKKNEHQNIVIKGTADQVKKVRELVEKISSGNGDTPKWNYIPGKKNKISYISTELLDIDKLHKDVFGKSGIEKDSDGFYNFAYYATKLYETKERLDKAKDGGDPDVEIETEYMENSKKFDKSRAKPYWSTKVEMFARAFEYYIQSNLDDKGIRSDYLQYDKAPVYMELYDMTPYPMGEERTYLNKLFKDFFDTVQEKVDEQTGNVALFRTVESKKSLAEIEWEKGISALKKISQKMGVDVEILETTEGLTGKYATAKGWYDLKTGKITIVVPNHRSSLDIQYTLLHEAVGHYGLRKLFGNDFNAFLDDVYNSAEDRIKQEINAISEGSKIDIRTATEEYLSKLAEDREIMDTDKYGHNSFLNKVKKFFMDMLAKIGFDPGFKLSDNELKYILWRSYQNLSNSGKDKNIISIANDVAMQSRLKVGNYAEKGNKSNVAEEPIRSLSGTITIDGVERPTTNSEGKQIAPTEEGIPLFKSTNKRNYSELLSVQTKFDSAKNDDDKHDAAVDIVDIINELFNADVRTVPVRNKRSLIQTLRNYGADEEQISSFENNDEPIQGAYYNGLVILNTSDIESSDELLSTWIHETMHHYTENNKGILLSLSGKVPKAVFGEVLPESYARLSESKKINELLSFLAERIVNGEALPDYDVVNDEIKPIIDNFLNQITNGRYKNYQDVQLERQAIADSYDNIERGVQQTSRDVGERTGTGKSGTNDGTGRSGSERNKATEEARIKKADNLYNNIDNIDKVIDYDKFLSDVLEGMPNKNEFLSNVEITSLDKAIENYLANIEDKNELQRIKDILGVDMPDNALQYLLWRNANKDDGSYEWKAENALKKQDLNANVLFRKGQKPKPDKTNIYENRIRSRYNRGFKSLMYGIEEGYIDRMNSLRVLQEAITGNQAIPECLFHPKSIPVFQSKSIPF